MPTLASINKQAPRLFPPVDITVGDGEDALRLTCSLSGLPTPMLQKLETMQQVGSATEQANLIIDLLDAVTFAWNLTDDEGGEPLPITRATFERFSIEALLSLGEQVMEAVGEKKDGTTSRSSSGLRGTNKQPRRSGRAR